MPSGGSDGPTYPPPRSFAPQQSTAPLVLRPQVWMKPALTDVKVPSSDSARPVYLPQSAFDPQHTTKPSPSTRRHGCRLN